MDFTRRQEMQFDNVDYDVVINHKRRTISLKFNVSERFELTMNRPAIIVLITELQGALAALSSES